MVLKEKIGEASGRLDSVRTCPNGTLEVTFRGEGGFLGHPIHDMGTILVETQETGGSHLKGDVMLVADDNGAMCAWKGFGVGKKDDRPIPAGNYGVAGEFPKATKQFAKLRDVCCAVEFKVEENETYHWDAYEWTA